ncbi:MAG TPA: 4'-phosphopantetheinyl transferase superfamily protein [Trueperaceae bacterium]|nr:4'-phosphopantetheinyl transferase superfamily protein [Trueperaceae bacterium]
MIVSVGIDMIELARVRAVLERHPERFLERHFHPYELADLDGRLDPVPGLAARFAAKEAFQKCWPETFGWRDVWVAKEGPRPRLAFAPPLAEAIRRQGLTAHLSLSHTREHAAAMAVLERRATPAG